MSRAACAVALVAMAGCMTTGCAREAAPAAALVAQTKGTTNDPATAAMPSAAATRAAMRQRLLTGKPADFHIDLPRDKNVWGVLMELGYPDDATVSVIALADGNASISVSTAPQQVIGGGDRPPVRNAALHVTEAAEEVVPHLTKTTQFPVPKLDQVTFYILTRNGVVTDTATQEELAGGGDPLSPLFMAGQDVITQLRLGST
jgi:hypothetical protein